MRNLPVVLATASAAILAADAGFAQSPDCGNPQTQLEMNLCAHSEFQAADGDLNSDYRIARDEMRIIDRNLAADLHGAEKALLSAQRAWIKYRDKACSAEGFIVRGGTMEPLIISSCLTRLTRQRSEDLRRLFENN